MNRYFVKFITLVVAVLAIMLLPACGQQNKPPQTIKQGHEVIDATGTKLVIKEKPQRVVSLSISTDEIVLDLLPPERIAGISVLADSSISSAIEKAKLVKNRVYAANSEGLMKLRPDLVIVPDFVSREAIRTLRELGMNVYVYKTQKDMEDVRAVIKDIGTLVGEEQKAEQIIAEFNKRLDNVKAKVKDIPEDKYKRVVSLGSSGAYYMPKRAFHDICRYAGAKDATIDLHYDRPGSVSKEEVVALNPDVFVIIDYNYDGKHDADVAKNELLTDKSYSETVAVKKKAVYILPGKAMLALSHHIAGAVEALAEVLYPDKF